MIHELQRRLFVFGENDLCLKIAFQGQPGAGGVNGFKVSSKWITLHSVCDRCGGRQLSWAGKADKIHLLIVSHFAVTHSMKPALPEVGLDSFDKPALCQRRFQSGMCVAITGGVSVIDGVFIVWQSPHEQATKRFAQQILI